MTKDPFPLLVIVRLLVALCVIFLVVTFVLAPMDRGRASDDGETGPTATVPLVPSAVALSILVLLFVAAEARSVYHREVARRQREILMAAAHELKSPLSALQSVGENMAGGIISSREHVRNYGDIVCRESKRLASAVEEILSHAVTSSGTQPAEATTVEKVDIPALIDDVLNTARSEADRRGAIVFLRVAPDLPLFPGSFTLLFEALHNLLINAIHNGREGNRIVIGARQEEMSNRRHVNLVVRDHGPGIDPSRLQTVFQLTGQGLKAEPRRVLPRRGRRSRQTKPRQVLPRRHVVPRQLTAQRGIAESFCAADHLPGYFGGRRTVPRPPCGATSCRSAAIVVAGRLHPF